MSGVYIIEIVPRRIRDYKYIKIGCSEARPEIRAHEVFSNSQFNSDDYFYNILETYLTPEGTSRELESLMIEKFQEVTGLEPFSGREWFRLQREEDLDRFLSSSYRFVIDKFMTSQDFYDAESVSICSIIKMRRKEIGYTQTSLGEAAGIDQKNISILEGGKIGHYSTLSKVLKVLDLELIIRRKRQDRPFQH